MNTPPDISLELFFDQLRDIYRVEIQLSESIPQLVSLCTNNELRLLIVNHADQNYNQIEAIAAIFERHGESPGDDTCKAMEGLIDGGTAHLEEVRSPHERDLMVVTHCLRIGHYEMAVYECTTLLSARLGLMREPLILSELLADEKDRAAALMELEPDLYELANAVA